MLTLRGHADMMSELPRCIDDAPPCADAATPARALRCLYADDDGVGYMTEEDEDDIRASVSRRCLLPMPRRQRCYAIR